MRLVRDRVELPDGDFVVLDWAALGGGAESGTEDSLPLVLVLHGLEGSAQSKYALETYRQLAARGVASVGLNFRSCGGELNRLPRLYHSGDTGDVRFIVDLLRQRFPHRPLGAIGFSLGGNVLLKYLGEEGRSGPGGLAGLSAAAAISVPYDLSAGADSLEVGFARIYVWRLLRSLKAKLRAKAGQVRGLLDLERAMEPKPFSVRSESMKSASADSTERMKILSRRRRKYSNSLCPGLPTPPSIKGTNAPSARNQKQIGPPDWLMYSSPEGHLIIRPNPLWSKSLTDGGRVSATSWTAVDVSSDVSLAGRLGALV